MGGFNRRGVGGGEWLCGCIKLLGMLEEIFDGRRDIGRGVRLCVMGGGIF